MMRDFGWIRNSETNVKEDLVVTWKHADLFKKIELASLTALTGLFIYKIVRVAFDAGAEAYDTAEYNTLCKLGLIQEYGQEVSNVTLKK